MKPFEWHGNRFHYIGTDCNGIHYWLQEATFDCDWYWGIGYVETFTNNSNPALSRDINSHSHFNYMLNGAGNNSVDGFRSIFTETDLSNSQIWKLLELMRSAYIAREYADMLHIGGAHYTTNPAREVIQGDLYEYERINRKVIPAIMREVYDLLDNAESN